MTQEPIQNIIQERIERTPYGATKTAELDLQFTIDPSFGLTAERYAWHSDDVLFDDSYFTEANGQIELETAATSGATARIRSAYPGRYFAHTIAEPGMGLQIPEQFLEYDTSGRGETVSLTHGEISAEIVEWDETTNSGEVAHGLSFESDATYVQIRSGDTDIEFVEQKNWNIDPMDGTGPSGDVLRPEKGYVYNFPYSWYGHGGLMVAIQDSFEGKLNPVHLAEIDGGASLATPNMPIQLTVENKSNAAALGANLGGMQFATHGSTGISREESGRTTEETRHTASNYIDRNVTRTNDAVDPFAEPGRPLISVRRDLDQLQSRVSLTVEVIDFFINSGGDLYVFIFDEFDDANALTGENFTSPESRNNARESRVETDTSATDYTPGTNAALRGMLYVSGDKNTAEVITGDSNSRLPIDATAVVTAALPPGSNSTYAQPALLTIREGF